MICCFVLFEFTDLFMGELDSLLHKVSQPAKKIIFGGDFNVNFADCNDNLALSLINLFSNYGMHSKINGDTRVTAFLRSQIDDIFCNVNDINCSDIYITNISDHYGQILSIKYLKNKHSLMYIKKRVFSETNNILFLNYIREETWIDVFSAQEVNEKYRAFFNILFYYFDLAFPVCTCRVRDNKPGWINTEIKNYSNYIKDLYVWYK